MIGQKKIKARVKELVESGKFPSFTMIVAPKGHGKKELAEYIKWMMGADLYEPDDLKVDAIRKIIEDGQALNHPRVYVLADSDDMTTQAQNAILKFSEEPPKNAFVIMTVEDEESVLPTIKSRAKVFKMDPYTKEELGQFIAEEFPSSFELQTDNLISEIAENPGQLIKLADINYEALMNTCQKVIDNIGKVSASNAFAILKHFHESQYEFIIPMMLTTYGQMFKKSELVDSALTLEMLKILYKYKALMKNKSVNKVNALEMMFIEMREAAWTFNR